MIDQQTYELIDDYLNGKLKGKELEAFEKRFITDKPFSEYVKKQKDLKEDLEFYGKRKALKNKLNSFHDELDITGIRASLFKTFKRKTRVRTFLYSIPAAAAVSIAVVFGALQFMGILSVREAKEIQLGNSQKEELFKEFKDHFTEEQNQDNSPEPASTFTTGTAIPISSNGYFLTSSHVVAGASSILVESKNDSSIIYHISPIEIDTDLDIAILRITDTTFKGFDKIPYNLLRDERDMGEYVYTVGYPKKDIVFNEGSISSITGFNNDTSSYQISIPVNLGNSGSPLLDEKGNLIGIITAKHSDAEGAAYAIKSSHIYNIMEELASDTLNPTPPVLTKTNSLSWLNRPKQIKTLKPYIFRVIAKKYQEE